MSNAVTEAMIEAATKVLNERLAKEEGLFGVSRDMLSAALSAGQAQPVAWQCQDKHGQWITMPGDWSPSENVKGYEYRPLYLHPPVQVPVVKEGWRPIETAPIDGTDILVCVTYNLSDDEWETMQWVDWQVPAIVWPVFRDRVDIPFPPTHWMPLPASPEQGETDA